MTIIIKCYDCHHTNREELGMPGFELLETNFTSFSEAHRHMMQHPDHYMDFNIIEEQHDDD